MGLFCNDITRGESWRTGRLLLPSVGACPIETRNCQLYRSHGLTWNCQTIQSIGANCTTIRANLQDLLFAAKHWKQGGLRRETCTVKVFPHGDLYCNETVRLGQVSRTLMLFACQLLGIIGRNLKVTKHVTQGTDQSRSRDLEHTDLQVQGVHGATPTCSMSVDMAECDLDTL